jgi:DNA-binding response OmpR family regulator
MPYNARSARVYLATRDRAATWARCVRRSAGRGMGKVAERKARIAVINDDTAFLDLMEELLEREEGYDVGVCREAGNAYGFVKEQLPDLVILDIRVGHEESGWTILELLTLDPVTRPIPVIVCSAALHSLAEHQPLLEQYGCEVLAKPFDLDALLAKIEAALGRGSREERPPGAGQRA